MLHAFARNKSRAYQRYLGVRDASEPRVSSEDEITSLIFGPLDFLPASDNWKLWKLVLQSHASRDMSGLLPPDYFSDSFAPVSCALEFWPRRDKIEPDLLITFLDGQGSTRSLLIELKWDSGISGDDQLEKQWLQYQSNDQAHSLHVFIAKRMGGLPPDRAPWACPGTDGAAGSRLCAVRWHEFTHDIVKLARLPDTSVPLERWCQLASGFLRQVGIRQFAGFHASVHLADAIPDQDEDPVQFWPRTALPTNV
jgi:hypothetical protein